LAAQAGVSGVNLKDREVANVQTVADGLTGLSVTCLHRVMSHIRGLPSVDHVQGAEFRGPASTDTVEERLMIGSRVSASARELLSRITQGRIQRHSTVRVIRTRQAAPVQDTREDTGGDVIVREVSHQLPLVVVHDDIAVLEDPHGVDRAGGLVVVRDEACVASLAACHDLVWCAIAVEGEAPRATLPAHLDQILGELAGGSTDVQAARNLHLSHRTVSRHVAELLEHLGARSRLQAGVVAVRSGLV
jgi:DNA-binding CsgD family transcriptional regulator